MTMISSFCKEDEVHSSDSQTKTEKLKEVEAKATIFKKFSPYVSSNVDEVTCDKRQYVSESSITCLSNSQTD